MRHWTNVLTIRKKLPGEALERTREINPTLAIFLNTKLKIIFERVITLQYLITIQDA